MGLVSSQQIDDDDLLRIEEYEELEQISGFSREEIRKLYRRFQTLDRSGNGSLAEEDLLRVPEVALNPMVERIVGFFGFGPYAMQLSGKSVTRVNFTDFVIALSSFNATKTKEEKLRHVFRTFDCDGGDGVISKDELMSLLRTLVGKSMSDNDVEGLVEQCLLEADHDGDNGLSFEEFMNVMRLTDVDKSLELAEKIRLESNLDAFHRKREREYTKAR